MTIKSNFPQILILLVPFFGSCKLSSAQSKLSDTSGSVSQSQGACGNSDGWSKQALTHASQILAFLESVKSRPECTGLIKAKPDIERLRDSAKEAPELSYRVARYLTLPREISDLVSFGATSLWMRDEARELLMSRTLELSNSRSEIEVESNMSSSMRVGNDSSVVYGRSFDGLKQRLDSVGTLGVQSFDKWISALEANPKCMLSVGAINGQILQTSVEMLGAFASADVASASKLGETANKYVNFLRTQQARQFLNQSQRAKLRELMSCLIGTVTSGYCASRDAEALLTMSANGTKTYQSFPVTHPAFGYELIFQYMPTMTDWLSTIGASVPVRVSSVSKSIQGVMEIPIDIQIHRRRVMREFDLRMHEISAISDDVARQGSMTKLIANISARFSRATFPIKAELVDNAPIPNFFDYGNQGFKIPFILSGIDDKDIPAIYIPGSPELGGQEAKNFTWYVEVNGPPPMMGSIELFRTTLLRGINLWMDRSTASAMEYYWHNIPVDFASVNANVALGARVTPIGAMRMLRDYQLHLVKLIRTHNPPGLRHFLPVAMDLVKRLDKVIDSFEAQPRGATADAARTFVREVYQQFEMVMFNQSFLQARLQPMVEAHINAVVAGSVPGKTELEGVLSMIGERGAVADLFTKGGMSQNDGQKLKIDLASARSTNLQSLEVLQQIFGDTLEDEISYLRQRAKNPVYDAKAVRSEAYRRSLRDARNSGFVSRDTSTDRFSRTFVDWVLLAKPRAAMARAMNRDLYPMPADGGFEGFSDDESKSFATMWSYLCVQALSMPDRKRYHRLCSGSSHGIAEYPNMPESMRGMLNLNHDDWWSDHEITRRPSEEGWTGGDPICTLYDFQRRWKIYHMAAERYFD